MRSSARAFPCVRCNHERSGEDFYGIMERTKKIPDASHPIVVERSPGRVVVTLNGETIADSRSALTLREASYPPVQYVPRADVKMSHLTKTNHATYCPYKGECSYFSITIGGQRSENGVWTYEDPHDAVREIREYVAFYPNAVDSIEID